MDGLFLDGWRDPCQDYFQSRSSIYYRRPLISPSLSDNNRAGEASGDLHLNLPLGSPRQPLRVHSRHFMLLSLPGDAVCSARGQNDSVYGKHGVSPLLLHYPFALRLHPQWFRLLFSLPDGCQSLALD